jgi:lysosomal acid lipase/cholesteryl ester hydrolase
MDVRHSVIVINVITVILSAQDVNFWNFTPARNDRLISYSLPEARELKMALGINEDTYLNFTELTTKYGYQSEQHTVTTEDGYILTIFRVLSKCNGTSKLYPILLVHGIIDTSDVWILPGEEFGLGYVLARNCYDVWFANTRGNPYSRRHVSLNPDKDVQYWEYSFDEHGNYDVPATVDHVLRVTKKSKLFYMGHSQGTTNFFIMTSLKPEYNQKVQLSIHYGPVAWMTNAYTALPFPRILVPYLNEIKEFLDAAGFREIIGRQQLMHFTLEILCHFATEATCGNVLYLATGFKQGTIKPEVLAIAFGHLLSGTSTKTVFHYAQLLVSRRFKRCDEGYQGNMKRYGLPKPPNYKVSLITSPVVLVSAQNDWLSSLKDIEKLSSKLPNLVENYVVPVRKWSHHNHLFDERAKKYVIPKVLQYLEQYNVPNN